MPPTDLIARYHYAFNARDWDGMLACISDTLSHDVNERERRGGKDTFAAFIAHMDERQDETLKGIAIMVSADGTSGTAEFIVNSICKQTEGGLPATCGQDYCLPAVAFFEISDDEITRVTNPNAARGLLRSGRRGSAVLAFLVRDIRLDGRERRAQRPFSHRKKRSNRRASARARLSKISARIARVRKVTTSIVRDYSYVAIEKFETKNMMRSAKDDTEKPGKNVAAKAGLNREILNVGWHQIDQMLADKLDRAGAHLEKVPAAYTSQACCVCGAVDKESRESQVPFSCGHCGHEMNADLNAPRNILMRANSPYLDGEACGCAACDASRTQRAP